VREAFGSPSRPKLDHRCQLSSWGGSDVAEGDFAGNQGFDKVRERSSVHRSRGLARTVTCCRFHEALAWSRDRSVRFGTPDASNAHPERAAVLELILLLRQTPTSIPRRAEGAFLVVRVAQRGYRTPLDYDSTAAKRAEFTFLVARRET
jgi:hypothetical protein